MNALKKYSHIANRFFNKKDVSKSFQSFGGAFTFLFKYICLSWRFWIFEMVLIPVILILYSYFNRQVTRVIFGDTPFSTNHYRDQLARIIQLGCLITSIFLLPIMTNIIFSSSLNYLFYIHRIKKTHLFIALFIINIFTIFITIAHAVWVGAVFFNKAFYIDDAIKINLVQSIYSIVVTIIFDSVLCIVLCALIKSRVILLFVNLAIIMVCLLLGSLLIDFDHITSNEPFYYLVLICPQGYLTQMNEMAFSSTTYYYINGLPSLNGSIFNPFDDYYVNYLYPYVIELKYHAWHIWLALFVPWAGIVTGITFIYKNTQKYKEVS